MPYTSVSKSDKNRFGLKSHTVPVIIAIAYLVDSIEAEMTLLRIATLILTVWYLATVCVAIFQRFRHSDEEGPQSSNDANTNASGH